MTEERGIMDPQAFNQPEMQKMARTPSGSNIVRISLKNPASNRIFRLSEIAGSSYIPAPFRDILKQFRTQIGNVRMLNTCLRELFEILFLDTQELSGNSPGEIFRTLRTFLKKEAQTEFAPPGNFTGTFSDQSRFIICQGYDLFSDPDIIAARTYVGHKNTNSLAAHRMRVAEEKISGFLVFAHLFEAIWLAAAPHEELVSEQRIVLKDYLEKTLFPDEGQLYLQYCFSGILSCGILKTNLSANGGYLKPLTPGTGNFQKCLMILGELAVLNPGCRITEVSSSECWFIDELLKYYQYALQKRNQNPDLHLTENISVIVQKTAGMFRGLLGPLSDVPEPLFSGEAVRTGACQAEICRNARKIRFLWPERLKFYDTGILYIMDVAVQNSYMYADTREVSDNTFWNFAINFRAPEVSVPREPVSTYGSSSNDSRKFFALSLQNPDLYPPSETLLAAIAGNLEYRLLAEGFLGTISKEKRMRAFSWLLHSFQNLLRINNSFSRDFRKILGVMGEDISVYLLLWPEEMTNSIRRLIFTTPFFGAYADIRLSMLAYCHGSLEAALSGKAPVRNGWTLSGTPIPPATGEEIQDLMFQKYILNQEDYTKSVRFSGDSSRLLYANARVLFRKILSEKPELLTAFLRSAVPDTTRRPVAGLFRALSAYKEMVFSRFFPGMFRADKKIIDELCHLAEPIKKQQDIIHQYLAAAGSNIQNDIVYRIMEHGISRNETALPGSLTVFRDRLTNEGFWSSQELKKAFGISNFGKQRLCIEIIRYTTEILGISMYPNPDYECYENMVSAFSSFSFRHHATLPPLSQGAGPLLCFRIALDAATVYTVQGRLLEFFKTWTRSANLPAAEAEALAVYASEITAIRQASGRACRPGSGLSGRSFSAAEQDLLKRMMHIVISGGDPGATFKNVTAINLHLQGKFLQEILDKYQRSTGPDSRRISSAAGNRPAASEKPDRSADSPMLDPELIRKKSRETAQVQEILAPIFSDTEDTSPAGNGNGTPLDKALGKNTAPEEERDSADRMPPEDLSDIVDQDGAISGKTIFGLLPKNCRDLILRLCQLGDFSEEDFRKICRDFGLMSEGAMEIINSWALEHLDCTLIEADDPMFFDRDLLNDLLQDTPG